MKQTTVSTKIMTNDTPDNDEGAKKLIRSLLGDATSIHLLDHFSNYEAGGYFSIYGIKQPGEDGQTNVCLFFDERHIDNPFDPRVRDEIELGYRWRVKGLFSTDGSVVARGQVEPMLVDGDGCYLYLLERVG